MRIYLARIIEANTVINAVGLGLRFKAERPVEHLRNAALKIGSVAKEVTDIELNARLVGVNVKHELTVSNRRRVAKEPSVHRYILFAREDEIMVVAYKIGRASFADRHGSREIKYGSRNGRGITDPDRMSVTEMAMIRIP